MAVTFQSHTFAKQSNGTTLSISVPASTVNGDLLLMRVDCTSNVNVTDPAGWVIIEKHGTCTNSSACTGQNIYYRIASSEPASYTISVDNANTYDATIWRITGHDTTNPIDSWRGQNGTGTTWTVNGITTIAANTLLCYFANESTAGSTAITATSDPTGFTNVNPMSDAINPGIGSYKAFVGPGATGNVAGTATGGAAGEQYVGHLIAIAPAGSSTANLSGTISTTLPPRGWIGNSKLYHAVYHGFAVGPLLSDIFAPVTNQIDIPTIDYRHAQVVFQGWWWSGIIAPNYPGYQWIDAPARRVRSGHNFGGEQRSPIPLEHLLGTNWTEPAQGFTRWRRHNFEGWAKPQYFIDAPIEIHGKRHWQNPMAGRFAQWSRMALSFADRPQSNIPDTARPPSFVWIAQQGVTSTSNNPIVISMIIAKNGPSYVPYENRARALKKHDFTGCQWWKIVDSPNPPIVATDLPVHGRRHDYGGYQWWKIIDSPMATGFANPLPVTDPRRRHNFDGWKLWLQENQPIVPFENLPAVMPRWRRGHDFSGWLAWQQADIPMQFQWTQILFGRTPRRDVPQFSSGPVLADTSLLNAQGVTAVHAYSTRRLRDGYAGNCLRVRRDSDNTTQDIGFNGDGDLDSAALLSFVGAGSGFLNIWYDQSGNGNDMTQATTAVQPRLVLTGAQDTFGAVTPRAAVFFDGTAMTIKTAVGALGTQPYTQMHVAKIANATGSGFYNMVGSGLNGNCIHIAHSPTGASGGINISCGVTLTYFTGFGNNTLHALALMANGTSSRAYHNGTSVTGSEGTNSWTGVAVGAVPSNANYFSGLVPEVITFASDITDTTIKNIQANQKIYWQTT